MLVPTVAQLPRGVAGLWLPGPQPVPHLASLMKTRRGQGGQAAPGELCSGAPPLCLSHVRLGTTAVPARRRS